MEPTNTKENEEINQMVSVKLDTKRNINFAKGLYQTLFPDKKSPSNDVIVAYSLAETIKKLQKQLEEKNKNESQQFNS